MIAAGEREIIESRGDIHLLRVRVLEHNEDKGRKERVWRLAIMVADHSLEWIVEPHSMYLEHEILEVFDRLTQK